MKYKIDLDATVTLMPTNFELSKQQHLPVEKPRYMVLEDLHHSLDHGVFNRLSAFYEHHHEGSPTLQKHSLSDIGLYCLHLGLESMENDWGSEGSYRLDDLQGFLEERDTLNKKISDCIKSVETFEE